jgi:hypothetical protein
VLAVTELSSQRFAWAVPAGLMFGAAGVDKALLRADPIGVDVVRTSTYPTGGHQQSQAWARER